MARATQEGILTKGPSPMLLQLIHQKKRLSTSTLRGPTTTKEIAQAAFRGRLGATVEGSFIDNKVFKETEAVPQTRSYNADISDELSRLAISLRSVIEESRGGVSTIT